MRHPYIWQRWVYTQVKMALSILIDWRTPKQRCWRFINSIRNTFLHLPFQLYSLTKLNVVNSHSSSYGSPPITTTPPTRRPSTNTRLTWSQSKFSSIILLIGGEPTNQSTQSWLKWRSICSLYLLYRPNANVSSARRSWHRGVYGIG
jgi:hypothetical protein